MVSEDAVFRVGLMLAAQERPGERIGLHEAAMRLLEALEGDVGAVAGAEIALVTRRLAFGLATTDALTTEAAKERTR